MFEFPVLSTGSELYGRYNNKNNSGTVIEGEARLNKKIDDFLYLRKKGELDHFIFVDMATKRRNNHEWQEYVLKELHKKCRPMFSGTSKYILKKNKFKLYQYNGA